MSWDLNEGSIPYIIIIITLVTEDLLNVSRAKLLVMSNEIVVKPLRF